MTADFFFHQNIFSNEKMTNNHIKKVLILEHQTQIPVTNKTRQLYQNFSQTQE